MNIRYSLAEISDLPLILQLVEEFYTLDGHVFHSEKMGKAIRGLIGNKAYGRLWLIMADEAPAGYVAVTLGYSLEYGGLDAFVDEIFLQEPYRGKGIGTQTFAFLEAECQKLAVGAVHLEVMPENHRAYRFYQQLGYSDRHSALLTKWL